MNNRNPFIPNVPTPQGGHWVTDPNIYAISNSSNASSQQQQLQVPFTAHQQMQFHQQPMYNYTTSASQLPSLPLQTNSTGIFSDAWNNVNTLNTQMNYTSYQQQLQQVNSFQQQHQQIAGGQIQVSQAAQRSMQLALDTSHFVHHFPVNLSPPSGLSLNSRSSNAAAAAAMAQLTRQTQQNNSTLAFTMQRQQFNVSPSSSPGAPLSLVDSSRAMDSSSSCANPSASPSNLSLSSRNNNSSNNVSSSNNNAPSYLSMPLLFNARPAGSMAAFSSNIVAASPPPPSSNCTRSPTSMSPFSGSSSSPSPTLQQGGGGVSGGARNMSFSSPQMAANQMSSFNSSANSRMARIPQHSPSPNHPQQYQQQHSSRSPVQQIQQAHQSSNSNPYISSSTGQISPAAVNRTSGATTTHHNLIHGGNLSVSKPSPPSPLPSIPPIKEKKPRAPRKPRGAPKEPKPPKEPKQNKRTPKKPIPINPSSLTSPPGGINNPAAVSNLVLPNNWPAAAAHLLSQIPAHLASQVQQQVQQPRNAGRSPPRNTNNNHPRLPGAPTLNQPLRLASNVNSAAPVVRTSVIQSSPQGQIPAHSQVHRPMSRPPSGSPPRAPLNTSPPHHLHHGAMSPTKLDLGANNRLSVLDYAMERAGIPSSSSTTQPAVAADIGSVENEILKLVSEIPEQATELLSSTGDKLKSNSSEGEEWEREAFNRALGVPPHDDLESELNRFYCPPSPKGPSTVTSSTQLESSSKSVSKSVTLTVISAAATTTTTSSTTSTSSAMKAKKDESDDDCEVILVKLSEKKRRRPPANAKRAGGGGIPPNKKMSMQQPGRGTGASRGGGRNNNAMTRSAYPNGRHISVAPKTTVPIPRAATPERTLQPKGTARKSTAGVAYTQTKKGYAVTPTPIATKVGRKPPTPRGSPRNKVLDEGLDPSLIIDVPNTRRAKRNVSEIDRFCIEPSPKLTRQQLKAMQEKEKTATFDSSDDFEMTSDSSDLFEEISPIKIKVNLKTGTSKNVHSPRAGPKSRKGTPPRNLKNQIVNSEADSLTADDSTTTVLNKSGGSEDDLQIVEEYYPDSDASFDLEGERDEASSESETEEEEDDEDSIKGNSNVTSTTTATEPQDKVNVGVEQEFILPDSSTADLEIGGGGIESKLDEKSTEDQEEELAGVELDDCRDNVESSEESEEEEIVDLTPKVFEMPKPKVILKGTKQDADKAVADMRNTLAQLSQFKFFGR